MSRTPDMFAELKPPRQAPRKLMHVSDAGDAGCADEDGSGAMVRMECRRCGYESEWLYLRTVTEARRGIPCPKCSEGADSMDARESEPHSDTAPLSKDMLEGADSMWGDYLD